MTHNKGDVPVLFWVATALGLLGTILNSLQRIEGFLLWMVSNPLLCWQSYRTGNVNMALMFLVYFSLSIVGVFTWSGYL
ncbi:MAG TPA: nicotinamide mononucleotide transporter [Methanobacteriaceae archaeon]|nr:nicotinamide mononucleotide transporter [Methanobacteriaceae archaeon]